MIEFWIYLEVVIFSLAFYFFDFRAFSVPAWLFTVFNFLGLLLNWLVVGIAPVILAGNMVLMGAFNFLGELLDKREVIGAADLMFVGTLFMLLPFPKFAIYFWGLPMAAPIVAFVVAGVIYSVVRWVALERGNIRVGQKIALGPFLLIGTVGTLLAIVF